ncbi:addiction module antidote protein [Alloscardovia omnicolens]|uniref:addiction module antidote protein n=1 Tax=Alloscardovia omnicolens TaxID=419015 RepID=UPI003A711C4D
MTNEKVKLIDWNPVDYLDDEETIASYLNEAAQRENPQILLSALGDVARAYGMGKVAKSAHVNRESLYKSLSENGHPSYETVKNVLKALGFTIHIKQIETK